VQSTLARKGGAESAETIFKLRFIMQTDVGMEAKCHVCTRDEIEFVFASTGTCAEVTETSALF
jgi:hypothetical protein